MNPGKIVNPYPITSNLRLGINYRPPEPKTHFAYPEDDGQFRRAAIRCVGVGKCRHWSGGVMCPSFMATRDETNTTRGRSRALFEMLKGDVIADGWKSREVHEALDLCLACKGCKRDCPMSVDMATYKAEFMAHYYQRRLRPRSAYAMGLIYWWSRLASTVPRLTNLAISAPGLSRALKAAGGIHPERSMPAYARQTFRSWFKRHESQPGTRGAVVLFPDTFNNFFRPGVASAAVEVLEQLGWRVRVPGRSLCCGRPLYAIGMLPTAKRLLRQIMRTLDPEVARGTPIVGLEPACVATFRDELTNLFPDDERARRLRENTWTLGEFLAKSGVELPALKRDARVHVHCNEYAVLDPGADRELLDRMGIEAQVLDSGCCGMAGSFGFEADHYEVAMKCGERVLLPAVREAERTTLIMTNGYSCREQIAQATEREALHLAQVIRMAMHRESDVRPYPERRWLEAGGLPG